jgi:hypothetical protein
MMRITTEFTVRTAPNVVSCELDGEAAILDLRSGEYYGMNEVGASVWSMIGDPRRIAEIIREITSQYEVEWRRCEDDILGLIERLATLGLVEIVDTG